MDNVRTQVRLQRTGEGSYYVYLPKAWVERLMITKRDLLSITLAKDYLLISPSTRSQNEREIPEADLRVPPEPDALQRTIISAYVSGTLSARFSRTDSRPFSAEQRVRANEALRKLLGIEFNMLDSEIIFYDLTDYSRFDTKNEMERLFKTVRAILKLTRDLLRTDPREMFPLAHLLHDHYVIEEEQVDPMTFHIHRSVNVLSQHPFLGAPTSTFGETQFVGIVSYILERLSDTFYGIGGLVAQILDPDRRTDLLRYPVEFIIEKISEEMKPKQKNQLLGLSTYAQSVEHLGNFLESAQRVVCQLDLKESLDLQKNILKWRESFSYSDSSQALTANALLVRYRLREASTYIESLANRTSQFHFYQAGKLASSSFAK